MPLRASDRLVVTGRTGSGKSVLARAIFDAAPAPKLLVDPKAAEGAAYAVTFRDPARLPDVPVARYVPADPADLDAYDRLYQAVWARRRPLLIWLDEARIAAPSTGPPRHLVTVVTQGRAAGIGHIACAQRPAWIAGELLSEADHLMAFPTHHPRDLDRLAEVMSVPPADVRGWFGRLRRHGFLHYDVRLHRVTLCPPIPR